MIVIGRLRQEPDNLLLGIHFRGDGDIVLPIDLSFIFESKVINCQER